MIAVPRGALEELIVRDFASRVHNMEPNTLAAFLDSLRNMSAPDIRSDPQRAARAPEPAVGSGTPRHRAAVVPTP